MKHLLNVILFFFFTNVHSSDDTQLTLRKRSGFATLSDLTFTQNNFFESKNKLVEQALQHQEYERIIDPNDPIFDYVKALGKLVQKKVREYQDAKLEIMKKLIAESKKFYPINLKNYQAAEAFLQEKRDLIYYLTAPDNYSQEIQALKEILNETIESNKRSIKSFQQIQNLYNNQKQVR